MKIYIESVIIILMVTTINISESLDEFCPEGEEFSVCGKNDCQPICRFPRGPKNCTDKCRPGCICYKTLVRRDKDKKCVTLEECTDNRPQTPSPPSRPGGPPSRPGGPPNKPRGQPSRPGGQSGLKCRPGSPQRSTGHRPSCRPVRTCKPVSRGCNGTP